jgi:predicted nicotinamide N-methyase
LAEHAAPELREELVRVGSARLSLLRPSDPEALLDDQAFERNEFLPYWAELWPAGLALAHALPDRLDGVQVIEVGCGLGIPSLVAARRGAEVLATDWADDAVELLRVNASRNGIELRAETVAWDSLRGTFDLVLAADVLYERRNVDALLDTLPRLASVVLLGLAGRPYENEFQVRAAGSWDIEEVRERVVRLASRPEVGPGGHTGLDA